MGGADNTYLNSLGDKVLVTQWGHGCKGYLLTLPWRERGRFVPGIPVFCGTIDIGIHPEESGRDREKLTIYLP